MILIMDTRTLYEEYIKEGANQLLIDEYVIVSSRVRKSKELDNVLNASNILYSMHQFLNFKDDAGSDLENMKRYREFLSKSTPLALLVSIIETDLTGSGNVILLCSPNEMKHQKYMKYLARCIEDMFHYPVYKYTKKMSLDALELLFDDEFKLKKCLKRIASAKEYLVREKISTEKGKEDYISRLSKKDLKDIAKRYEKDIKGLSKDELRDILRDNF